MDKFRQPLETLVNKGKNYAQQHRRRTFGIVVILLLLIWIFFPENLYTPSAPPIPVTVAPVIQKHMRIDLYASGTAQAYNSVTVKSRVDGHITEIKFKPGQTVKEGELLFVLDPRPFEVALDQARANLTRDQATFKFKQENLKRYTELVKKNYVSQSEYELAKSDADAAAAMVQAAEAAVKDAELKLQYCYIHAPISGQSGDILIKIGGLVRTNDTQLVIINEISPIKAEFALPEQYWLPIQANYQKGDVIVEAHSPQTNALLEKGKLIFMDNTINSATGTFGLKASFENTTQHLWPGQYLKIYIPLEMIDNAIVIPSRALQESNQGPYVFVVDKEDVVSIKHVTIGATVKDETIITAGLTPGETVVTEGQFRLSEGSHVAAQNKVETHDHKTASP